MSTNGHTQYTAAQFKKAIGGSGGIIDTIAKRVGCGWHTARKYIDTDADIKQAYNDECETVADNAESVLIKSIRDGSVKDAKWYLSRIRRRKYSERQELVTDDSEQITINVVYREEDDPDD